MNAAWACVTLTPARGAGIAGTPHRPVEEPGWWRQHAEQPLAGVDRGAVEYPGEELGRAAQALALPGGLPERGPALRSQVCLNEGQGAVLLVLHMCGQRAGQR